MHWISTTRKSGEHLCVTYRNTDSYFDLIWSHQPCMPWFPSLEIETVTTVGRAKTLPLSHQPTSHSSDTKSTSHGICTANQRECVFQVTSIHFTEDTVTSRATSLQRIGNTHLRNYHNLKGDDLDLQSSQLPWIVDLSLLVCNVGRWLNGRVLALHSVVASSISSEGDHGIHCWRGLIRS